MSEPIKNVMDKLNIWKGVALKTKTQKEKKLAIVFLKDYMSLKPEGIKKLVDNNFGLIFWKDKTYTPCSDQYYFNWYSGFCDVRTYLKLNDEGYETQFIKNIPVKEGRARFWRF